MDLPHLPPTPFPPISTFTPPAAELDEDQQAAIIDAMFERKVAAGEVVIR